MAAVALASASVLTVSWMIGEASAAENAIYARLYNQGTGKCLAVPHSSMTNGIASIQWTCSVSESQFWAFESASGGYRVRNLASGKCLAIGGGSTANGATAIQWTCGTGKEQVWVWDNLDRLKNVNSGRYLAIPGGSTTNSTEAIQWTGSESTDQQWLW
ncbi:RICIN domain-containing protein [Nonomuraea sp. NPDC002799]